MTNANWWLPHSFIILLQIIACFGYITGSWRFYQKQKTFLWPLAIGIICDIIITVVASSGLLPRMADSQDVPWNSWLFVTHISTASFGMFGFIFLWLYTVIKHKPSYPQLRLFQFWILLPAWCLGVLIALINFGVKLIFQIRVYDYL